GRGSSVPLVRSRLFMAQSERGPQDSCHALTAPHRPGLPRVDRSRVFRRLRRDARRLDPLLERLATTVDLVCPPGWDAAAAGPRDGSEREAAEALAPRRLGGLRRRGAREAAPDGLRHPTGADRRLG